MTPPREACYLLTPLDNFLSQVTRYSHRIIFFPDSDHGRGCIAQHMRKAFTRMTDELPWIAGSVTNIKHEHQHGRLAITAPWMTVDDLVTVNELDYLNYAKLKADHFPLESLIEEEVWPQTKLSGRPALQAQINFVQGGIILAIRASHCVTDGHGLMIIFRVWATYCRGEDGSVLLGPDSLERGRLMSGTPANLSDFSLYMVHPREKQKPENGLARVFFKLREWVSNRVKTSSNSALRLFSNLITYRGLILRGQHPTDVDTRVEIFFFSAGKLRELKEVLTASKNAEGQPESKAWISTHDGLVSLIGCCITEAWKDGEYFDRDSNPFPLYRMLWQASARTTKPATIMTFFINGRRFIKDPPLQSYIGNVITINSLVRSFDDLCATTDSVSRYAYAIREKVNEIDGDYLMRLVGALGSVPDVTRTSFRRGPFPQSTICINSWAAMNHYDIDWGREVGGRCEAVRISKFIKYDPFFLVLPMIKAEDGFGEDECGLEVVMFLKSTYMRKLKENKFFTRFAEWRCN